MMVADALRRNRKITSTTSATAIARWNCTSATESRIDSERSSRNCMLDRGRHLGAERRQPLAHRVDHRDGVGVGLALDREHDGALVVEPARDLVVLDAVEDAGDLVELHRHAVAVGDR